MARTLYGVPSRPSSSMLRSSSRLSLPMTRTRPSFGSVSTISPPGDRKSGALVAPVPVPRIGRGHRSLRGALEAEDVQPVQRALLGKNISVWRLRRIEREIDVAERGFHAAEIGPGLWIDCHEVGVAVVADEDLDSRAAEKRTGRVFGKVVRVRQEAERQLAPVLMHHGGAFLASRRHHAAREGFAVQSRCRSVSRSRARRPGRRVAVRRGRAGRHLRSLRPRRPSLPGRPGMAPRSRDARGPARSGPSRTRPKGSRFRSGRAHSRPGRS